MKAMKIMKIMKPVKTFPAWLIYVSAIGLGFFCFVICGGVLLRIFGPKFGSLVLLPLVILPGLAAAYFGFRYSRKFMMRHVSRNAEPGDPHFSEGRTARSKRIALAMLFSGLVFFIVFIFTVLSSIMNAYA